MSEERVTSAELLEDEVEILSLRPQRLAEYIGQNKIKKMNMS